MPYSALDVAKAFLAAAHDEGKLLTNMQVQKLVFIAHGFNLAFYDAPLIEEEVKAWQWGPVIPPLYNKLKKFGSGTIDRTKLPEGEPLSLPLISKVWESYKGFSGAKLSEITHREGTPWTITWQTNPFGVIPQDLIHEHYKGLIS